MKMPRPSTRARPINDLNIKYENISEFQKLAREYLEYQNRNYQEYQEFKNSSYLEYLEYTVPEYHEYRNTRILIRG
jgi:hypothetical protein